MVLAVVTADGSTLAEVTATELRDRDDRRILSVIEQIDGTGRRAARD